MGGFSGHDLACIRSERIVFAGLGFALAPGEALILTGPNGSGKSSLLRLMAGIAPPAAGLLRWNGAPVADDREGFSAGTLYLGHRDAVKPALSVRENLEIASKRFGDGAWTIERVIDLFPRLGERLDNGGMQLSGGEQQMLAIARALLMNPRLLVLDEPTEGLAPIIVKLIHDKLQDLRREGLSMVLVEQNFGFATSLADDVVVVGKGQVVWSGSADEIRADVETQHKWLGV